MRLTVIIITIAIVGFAIYVFQQRTQEGFCGGYTRINCPTRNMSYDLRGEAAFPTRAIVPFMYSTIGPTDPRACVFRGPLV